MYKCVFTLLMNLARAISEMH